MVPARPSLEGVGGWGSEAKKKGCVPKIDLKVPAPLNNFIFCRRTMFLKWVGGGGVGAVQGPKQPPPPPPAPGVLEQ